MSEYLFGDGVAKLIDEENCSFIGVDRILPKLLVSCSNPERSMVFKAAYILSRDNLEGVTHTPNTKIKKNRLCGKRIKTCYTIWIFKGTFAFEFI